MMHLCAHAYFCPYIFFLFYASVAYLFYEFLIYLYGYQYYQKFFVIKKNSGVRAEKKEVFKNVRRVARG